MIDDSQRVRARPPAVVTLHRPDWIRQGRTPGGEVELELNFYEWHDDFPVYEPSWNDKCGWEVY